MKNKVFKSFADPRIRKYLPDMLGDKTFSILGDSISTWGGISNDGDSNATLQNNAVFYSGTRYVRDSQHTWWGMLEEKTGMKLLVNNSWSGSCVCENEKMPGSEGCGERSTNLHSNNGEEPDMIFVYLGTNDYANGVDLNTFATSYERMLVKMKDRYTHSKIYSFTLLPHDRDFTTDNPIKVDKYNEKIRDLASKHQISLVDLEQDLNLKKSWYRSVLTSRRALHPNEGGMDMIALSVINALVSMPEQKNEQEA